MKKRGAEHDEFADIRDGVRALCAKFPGEYWRALDRERAYPTEFVSRADKGRLSRRPHSRGIWRQRAQSRRGRRNHGGDTRLRRQWRCLSCADVHDGHDPASRQRCAERTLSAADRERRTSSAGLRRDRTDLGHRHFVPAHGGAAGRQRSLRHQRAENLDIAGRTLGSDTAACKDDAEGAEPRSARKACRFSWWICGSRKGPISSSIRSAP